MSQLAAALDCMDRAEVDLLILGREANARRVADTTRLWLAGTRSFSPGCVVVRATGAVHVLSNTDDAVPAGTPVERLYGITWNPEKLLGSLLAIPGFAEARRVAVDGMTPMMFTMRESGLPQLELADANALLASLWLRPEAEQVDGVMRACEVAVAGLTAMTRDIRPGVQPRELRGVCAAEFATFGVTTPAFEAVATPFDQNASTWLPPDRPLSDGERAVLRAGALCDGWEGSIARTYVVGTAPAEIAAPARWNELVATCRPGTMIRSLRNRDAVVYGAGRGVEPWDDDVALAPGMMLALELTDAESLRQDIFRITEGGSVPVTYSA